MATAAIDDGVRVRAHYDGLLGPVYEWMAGGVDAALAAARAELQALAIGSGHGRHAIDLGAGIGAHTVALAEAGFTVTALDTCLPLLHRLRERAAGRSIAVVADDLAHVAAHASPAPHVVLCLGDTLTHLDSLATVDALMAAVAGVLAPGGVFVATFRDYSAPTALGVQRVIPVRQDADRLLTCVLEYRDDRVVVHDLLHERIATRWTLRASAYEKLRLAPARVCAALETHGLAVRQDAGAAGMTRIVALRPA